MPAIVKDPDGNVVVEEQNLERAILKLELTTDGLLFYPHVDEDTVHVRAWSDTEGSWTIDDPMIYTVEYT